jgi:hypothetical protein
MHQIKSYLVSDRRNDEISESTEESEREIESARFNAKNHLSEQKLACENLYFTDVSQLHSYWKR